MLATKLCWGWYVSGYVLRVRFGGMFGKFRGQFTLDVGACFGYVSGSMFRNVAEVCFAQPNFSSPLIQKDVHLGHTVFLVIIWDSPIILP